MANFSEADDSNFEQEVLGSDLPVLLDFYADWCGPCRALLPTLEDISREYDGKVRIVKLNVDNSPETRDRFGIRAIPTLLLFKDGEQRATVNGAPTRSRIADAIEDMLGDA
ncbi:thioredoxin [Sphingopyxis sp.]|uniref:thioredoxin n=1 Tax=Sphingopyxis sp. TaxID=1908224 RepID=UPI0026062856|nr:thioredoxin [Sphingopyxis sp.]MCW0199449.1 thioredoxin [Sphingopyxis sp.]